MQTPTARRSVLSLLLLWPLGASAQSPARGPAPDALTSVALSPDGSWPARTRPPT